MSSKVDSNAEGVEQTTHTPGAPAEKKASKHKSFDDIPTKGSGIPDGKYTARIEEMVLQDFDESKGQSVRFKVMIADDAHQGEEITGWWKIYDENKDIAGGATFFKRTMGLLEVEVTEATIAEVCAEITEQKPGVAIQKKTNGNFENVYFNGVVDDSAPTLMSLRENFPY